MMRTATRSSSARKAARSASRADDREGAAGRFPRRRGCSHKRRSRPRSHGKFRPVSPASRRGRVAGRQAHPARSRLRPEKIRRARRRSVKARPCRAQPLTQPETCTPASVGAPMRRQSQRRGAHVAQRRTAGGRARTGREGQTRIGGVEQETEFCKPARKIFRAFPRKADRQQGAPGREPQLRPRHKPPPLWPAPPARRLRRGRTTGRRQRNAGLRTVVRPKICRDRAASRSFAAPRYRSGHVRTGPPRRPWRRAARRAPPCAARRRAGAGSCGPGFPPSR